jgi:hypothetical protein
MEQARSREKRGTEVAAFGHGEDRRAVLGCTLKVERGARRRVMLGGEALTIICLEEKMQ